MSKVHKPQIMAGEDALLARRYANALLALAEDKKVVEAVEADLIVFYEAIENDSTFDSIASHPRLEINDVLKMMDQIIDKAELNDLTAAFLRQVVKARRLPILGLMIQVFAAELAKRRGEITALVTVASALSEKQEKDLAKQLSSMVGGSVQLYVEQDASLMGGLVIKMGSRLIDASIKGKLARLERQLKLQQEAA